MLGRRKPSQPTLFIPGTIEEYRDGIPEYRGQ